MQEKKLNPCFTKKAVHVQNGKMYFQDTVKYILSVMKITEINEKYIYFLQKYDNL